jgi:hypothetical protein
MVELHATIVIREDIAIGYLVMQVVAVPIICPFKEFIEQRDTTSIDTAITAVRLDFSNYKGRTSRTCPFPPLTRKE